MDEQTRAQLALAITAAAWHRGPAARRIRLTRPGCFSRGFSLARSIMAGCPKNLAAAAARHVRPAPASCLRGPGQHLLVGQSMMASSCVEFGVVKAVKLARDEAAENQVHLLDATVGGAPEQALAADGVVNRRMVIAALLAPSTLALQPVPSEIGAMRPPLLNPLFAGAAAIKGIGQKLDKLLAGFLRPAHGDARRHDAHHRSAVPPAERHRRPALPAEDRRPAAQTAW